MRPYIEFKANDPVRLVRDQPVGYRQDSDKKTYNKRIMYYEGECIRLGPDEWKALGTAQIQLISEEEYHDYWSNAPRIRLFACGARNRFQKWYRKRVEPLTGMMLFAALMFILWMVIKYH